MQQPLRIIHTEASLGWGGQEIRIFTEMLAMRERGHHLALVAQVESKIFQRCLEAGFDCETFSANRLYYPLSILRLRDFFRQWKVQIVNTHSSRDGYIAGIAARLIGAGLVRSRHIEVDYPNRSMSRWAFGGLPHHVTTTSERIKKRLVEELRLQRSRVSCVPTGIDLEKYAPINKSVGVKSFSLPIEKRFVGIVSVLRSWKGHQYFLDAAKEILVKRNDVCFLIAGSGPMESRIREWITEMGLQDVVQLLGYQEDVSMVLGALDVVVLPSYAHEGIPQILLQAQAMGKPIVATRVGGIPEIVQDQENGLLVRVKEGQALAQSILRLLDDEALSKRLGENGRRCAQQDYSLDVMCEKTEAIYREVWDEVRK